ncbi:MAG TPA: hypothetical protein VEC60_19170 [Reyranella sp.]|nr:hypothetical protein [Reyranella sp.]
MAGKLVRMLAVVIGAYAATSALVAAACVLLPLAGMTKGDALTLCGMLGFIVYLVLALWAAVERRLAVVWGVFGAVVLAGGSAVAVSL